VTSDVGPRGTIYDLSYQRYEGERLGRRFAVWSLYLLSVRSAFGLGRGTLPKVLAFGLVLLAFIPALVQVMLAAVVPVDEFDFVQPYDYYGFIQIIIILFVAALASDLVGNDRRYGTMSLYFSRPIRRGDYAAAKLAALATSLLSVTVAPQVVMFAGNWLGSTDALDWARENAEDFAPIVASGVMICVMFGALALVTATYAERRSFAMVAVLALFVIPFITVQVLVSVTDAEAARYAVLFSPVHVMRGFTLVAFNEIPPVTFDLRDGSADDVIAFVDLADAVLVLAAFGYTIVATAFLFTRFRGSL
jgi:ABC-2 type transport system permease protein